MGRYMVRKSLNTFETCCNCFKNVSSTLSSHLLFSRRDVNCTGTGGGEGGKTSRTVDYNNPGGVGRGVQIPVL
jgi:hypothetical protein